jgi:C-terminal processing protease CtpA/Prc
MRTIIIAAIGVLLTACGGGGSSSGTQFTPVGWTSGQFQPASTFVNKCAMPRTGTDPFTNKAYPDKAGTTLDENNWLRSWSNDLYLWFDEIVDQNPANFATTLAYFDVLKTMAITASGAPKDKPQFHFIYKTSEWESLSQSGEQIGYGAQWVLLSATPPRQVVVAFTEPGSPATTAPANLARGAEVLRVDGVDLVNDNTQAGVDTLNAGLFPATLNETHTFVIQDVGAAVTRTVTLTSANITSHPVQNVTTIPTAGGGTAGYMLFNDHLATSEGALVSAFTTLQAAGVTDLVLDIRYNGGGFLDIASEVAYMIAGPAQTSGQTFELTQFNSKHPTVDPVAGGTITPTLFLSTTQGFSTTSGQALPTLNLARVFVLTSGDTCSASESIINSLTGIGVEVVQIGSTTCGKPYGFYPQDNCGTTYFSIEFRGVNAMNFGDYTDGFSPQNAPVPTNAVLPGCSVADDFSHQLGDPAEGRLAAALNYIATPGACPTPASGLAKSLLAEQPATLAGIPLKAPPSRALRILTHPFR